MKAYSLAVPFEIVEKENLDLENGIFMFSGGDLNINKVQSKWLVTK